MHIALCSRYNDNGVDMVYQLMHKERPTRRERISREINRTPTISSTRAPSKQQSNDTKKPGCSNIQYAVRFKCSTRNLQKEAVQRSDPSNHNKLSIATAGKGLLLRSLSSDSSIDKNQPQPNNSVGKIITIREGRYKKSTWKVCESTKSGKIYYTNVINGKKTRMLPQGVATSTTRTKSKIKSTASCEDILKPLRYAAGAPFLLKKDPLPDILMHCTQGRAHFKDLQFDAEKRSGHHFSICGQSSKHSGVVHSFQRASDIFPHYDLFHDSINMNDVVQGQLGDCWLISTIASLANQRPNLIRAMFGDETNNTTLMNEVGVYSVRLWDSLAMDWFWIVVDDLIPLDSTGIPVYTHSTSASGALWPLILEKVFAKLVGSYEYLNGSGRFKTLGMRIGIPMVIRLITGTRQNDITEFDLNVHNNNTDTFQHDLFRHICNGLKRKAILSCCTSQWNSRKRSVSKVPYLKRKTHAPSGASYMGIMSRHAYTLVGVAVTQAGNKLLRIRNPHGKGNSEWQGKWSRSDPIYKETIKELQVKDDEVKDDGTSFYMELKDFIQIFTSVTVGIVISEELPCCSIIEGNWVADRNLCGGIDSTNNPQFYLSIPQGTQLAFTMSVFRDKLMIDEETPIQMMLCVPADKSTGTVWLPKNQRLERYATPKVEDTSWNMHRSWLKTYGTSCCIPSMPKDQRKMNGLEMVGIHLDTNDDLEVFPCDGGKISYILVPAVENSDWLTHSDPKTGKDYFSNKNTGRVTWSDPKLKGSLSNDLTFKICIYSSHSIVIETKR